MDVLIVDDSREVSTVYGQVLERAGYMVKAVDNGLDSATLPKKTPTAVSKITPMLTKVASSRLSNQKSPR